MADAVQFLAMDYGAESGRCELATLRDSKLELEEIHRFRNRPVRMAGTLYWDFPYLFAECLESLRICAEKGIRPAGIGVDTWGVDFGLLDSDGKLLGNPVHYRDGRTEGIHDYTGAIMSTEQIFEATSCEPWPISSLFQLAAMQREGSPLLEAAETFLNMPDLFNYFLSGVKRNEVSITGTGNLLSVDGTWCREVIDRFKLPAKMFGELTQPGTVLGPLLQAIQDETGIGGVPVVAVASHDTAAAVAAVPAQGDNWAFVSCGTWSILGAPLDRPIATLQALEMGFTNEPTVAGWFICRNTLGLWLVQRLRAKWDTPGDPWDYERLTAAAAEAGSGPLVPVDAPSLLAPADMEEALLELIRASGQPVPDSRGEMVRGVLESLALEHSRRLAAVSELTGRSHEAVYMVGGGVANKLLCRLTAEACGVPVHAGLEECTAAGNALVQAMAVGLLAGPEDIREVSRASFDLTTYEPHDEAEWSRKRRQYAELTSQGAQ